MLIIEIPPVSFAHTRSNSFPSQTAPVVSQFDEQLNRIRSSELASSSSTSCTLNSKLSILGDLYDSMDEFLQLPSSRKALLQQGSEAALDGSIKLLDICTTIIDVLVQMKERAQELQSVLRRRSSKDEIVKEVAQYLKSRKSAIKSVTKALKELKKIENTQVVSKLGECQMATLNMLESILVAIAGPKVSKSVISKLLKSKRVANQQETEFFLVGFEASDAVLNKETLRSGLENMEISIKNVEEGVENLFRHLIKTRTTLLNIFNC